MCDVKISNEGADRLTERSGRANFTLTRENKTVN